MTTIPPKELKVTSSKATASNETVPQIELKGPWLKSHGFDIGTELYLTCESENITLQTPSNYHISKKVYEFILDHLKRVDEELKYLKEKLSWPSNKSNKTSLSAQY